MNHSSIRLFSAAIVLFVSCLPCLAGSETETAKPFSIGAVHTIASKYLEETRTVNVYLPPSYDKKPGTAKDEKAVPTHFPVLYVLDGSAHEDFLHIVGLVQFLTMYELMPETLVVGIANKGRSRYRDFTSKTTVALELKNIPNAGGSPKFLDFVEKEVQPLLEKHYRTKPERTVIGQSLGGLLAVETLITRPAMFDQYIIVSPSLWWNNRVMLEKQVPAFLKSQKKLDKKIYIAVGEEGDEMKDVAKKLAAQVEEAKIPGVVSHFKFLPDEDHATVLHIAAYHGLRTLYKK